MPKSAAPQPAQIDRRQVSVDDAQLGPMAAADLRATLQLAAGLQEADHLLCLHRLETGILHMHKTIDSFVLDGSDV